jgi:DNA primase
MDIRDEIKSKIAIEDLIGSYLELKRAGRNYKALSPFTVEKTPSFVVSPEKGIWHDFSTGRGGDIFTFVMQIEGLDFKDALKKLAQKAGVELKNDYSGNSDTSKIKNIAKALNEEACLYYQKNIESNKEAHNYVYQVRKLNKNIVQKFRIGYSKSIINDLSKHLLNKGYTNEQIIYSGLAIKSKQGSLVDIFRGRIMIPLLNLQSEVVGFTSRILKKDDFGPKYLNTPQTLIYNKSELIYGLNFAKESLPMADSLILVEGNMDVIASYQAGVPNAIAMSGTAFSSSQIKTIQRFVSKIDLCFDNDKAGLAALERSLESLLINDDLEIRKIILPSDTKDADELIQAYGNEKWKDIILAPTDALNWLISRLASEYDLKIPTQQAEFANRILKLINKINNPISKNGYKQNLANVLKIKLSLLDEVANLKSNTKISIHRQNFKQQNISLNLGNKYTKLSKELLALVYKSKAPNLKIFKDYLLNSHQQILFKVVKPSEEEESELILIKDELLQNSTEKNISEFKEEIIKDYLGQLKSLKLKIQKDDYAYKIQQAETDGDSQLKNKLIEEYQKILRS